MAKMPELISDLAALYRVRKPAFVWGKPGVGKSDVIRAFAHDHGAECVDIRLSTFDPVDLRGLPYLVDQLTKWARPAIWPNDPSKPTVLFFDEMDRAAVSTANAALQIVLDGRIGEHMLPSTCYVVAAGNGRTDRVGTNKISSAQANRFVHLEIEPDAESWCAWATAAGKSPWLTAFISFRAALIHGDAIGEERAFPSPRAWATVDEFIDLPEAQRFRLASGTVGKAAAGEFEAFLRTASRLPRIADILANPSGAMVPTDHSARYAVSAALAAKADQSNFAAVLDYMRRVGREFEIMAATFAVKRDRNLCNTRAYVEWAARNQDINL